MFRSLFFLFIFFSSNLASQTHEIVLNSEDISIDNLVFFIDEVIDSRSNKNNDGYNQTNDSLISILKIRGGIDSLLNDYFKNNQKNEKNRIHIIIRITEFNIIEKNDDNKFGRAQIQIQYFLNKSDSVAQIFQTSAFAENYGITDSFEHEKRISKAIQRCFYNLSNSNWNNENLKWINKKELYSSVNPNEIFIEEKGEIKLKLTTDLLNIGYSKGLNGQGIHLQYLTYIDTLQSGKWFIPASFSFSGIIIDSEILVDTEYDSWSCFTGGVLIPLTYKANENILISIQGNIGIGAESFMKKDIESKNSFIFKAGFDQIVLFVPKNNIGINFGIGTYEYFITSKLYNWDIGFKIILGMKF